MAVWGAPSPVAMEGSFDVKVGVKCSEGCRLAGQLVHVVDQDGFRIGEGRLGEVPWQETQGLFVAELSLPAPASEDVFNWSASFAGAELDSSHGNASAAFSFRTARPPEHTVLVKVTDSEAGRPLGGVAVSMGIYRETTNARGFAKLELPTDNYELTVRKRDYEAPPTRVEVDGKTTVEIEARPLPATSPEEEQVWM